MTQTNSLNNSSSVFNIGSNPQTASANIPLTIGKNVNATCAAVLSNTNSGSSSVTEFEIASDLAQGYIIAGSSTNSVSRWKQRVEIGTNTSSNGLNLTSASPTGDIRMYVRGNTLASTIDSSGVFNLVNPPSLAVTGILTGNGSSQISGSPVTASGVLIGGGANTVSSLAVASSGTVLSGVTGTNPAFTATPSLTSLTITGSGTSTLLAQNNSNAVLGIKVSNTTSGTASRAEISIASNQGEGHLFTTSSAYTTIARFADRTGITSDTGIAGIIIDSAAAAGVVDIGCGGQVRGTFTTTGLNSCAIGATTASTGAFTTCSASTALKSNTIQDAAGNAAATLASTGGQWKGNNTNTAAPAGYIGEVLSSTVANNINLTTGNNVTITSLSITAGNWIVFGTIAYQGDVGISNCFCGINAAANTFTTPGVDYSQNNGITPTAGGSWHTINSPMIPLSLSATTTYYLNGLAIFASTCVAGGKIQAVRIG